MRESVDLLCKTLDYRFNDPRLLEHALTHRSAGGINNERLEFLGDAILGFIISARLCEKFPEADEGQLSRLRSRLVKKESLANLARQLDLGKYLILGPGELRSGGQSRDSILADALEALFAAVFLDSGYRAARRAILRLFSRPLSELGGGKPEKDAKTRLQEYLQARRLSLPAYRIVSTTGSEHAQTFQVSCSVPVLEMAAVGRGSSRRRAEQDAAARILRQLKNE